MEKQVCQFLDEERSKEEGACKGSERARGRQKTAGVSLVRKVLPK